MDINVNISVVLTTIFVAEFLPRDAMLTRYMLSSRVCPSVCLSVRPSQAGTVPKRINVGSRKQRRAIAQGLEYSDAKI